jgi:hypothetical protein
MLAGPLYVQIREHISLVDICLSVFASKLSVFGAGFTYDKSVSKCPEARAEKNGRSDGGELGGPGSRDHGGAVVVFNIAAGGWTIKKRM